MQQLGQINFTYSLGYLAKSVLPAKSRYIPLTRYKKNITGNGKLNQMFTPIYRLMRFYSLVGFGLLKGLRSLRSPAGASSTGGAIPISRKASLRDSLSRPWWSYPVALTVIISPSLTTSSVFSTRWKANWEIWTNPSLPCSPMTPGITSTKQPKSVTRVTFPS